MRDAIISRSDGIVTEPNWPAVDFVVGNPPFLGTKKLRAVLGDDYVKDLFQLYEDRIPNFSDLCCYWFEKARVLIEDGKCHRAGLLATQGIRGGRNREVLNRIKQTGDIFFGISSREWVLEGANVNVSMVGFDDGTEASRTLDGQVVSTINADLTSSSSDMTTARQLKQNVGIAFYADVKSGKFDIPSEEAIPLLSQPNPNGRPNSDVLRPWVNGFDILRRPRDYWVIDFPSDTSEVDAARYETPFALVKKRVYPTRSKVKRPSYRDYWWVHAEPCDKMRQAVSGLSRFLATPYLAKHRVFGWLTAPTLADHQLVVFARDDDYFFGVLHSRVHEVWSLRKGTRQQTRPRYTPTTTFETFPFPSPTEIQRQAIAEAARALESDRSRWLNPPDWVRQEEFKIRASVDSPWGPFIAGDIKDGIGTATYVRVVSVDATSKLSLKKRTLTKLYNQKPAWLVNAHNALNEVVFAAYGWSVGISDDELLTRLLELNLAYANHPVPAET